MGSPAKVAGNRLVALGVCTATDTPTGWTLKVGKSPSGPDKIVAMFDTGGMAPNPKWAVDFPSIMASVRGAPNAYDAAWDKAREVRDALLGLSSLDLEGDRWVSITCPGDIGLIGYDDKQRPELSINFRLIIEPANVGNREAL